MQVYLGGLTNALTPLAASKHDPRDERSDAVPGHSVAALQAVPRRAAGVAGPVVRAGFRRVWARRCGAAPAC